MAAIIKNSTNLYATFNGFLGHTKVPLDTNFVEKQELISCPPDYL